MTSVAIIDYGSGNLHSAAKAFERAARGSDTQILVTSDPDKVRQAERIVLPGVGAFRDCHDGLKAVPGMWQTLEDEARRGKPLFGICVGMQLMAARGLEHVETKGFGWIDGDVKVIEPADSTLKIPHMGWNTLDLAKPHRLFDGIALGADGLHAYFVHSYHMALKDEALLIATADYGGKVTAFVARDNIAGSQFHPEKSQALGLALIANFLEWRP
ncbi:imidazole glycerol phosphate synthase subunit HisH [Taklimakanibacter lacteus]|uniref:imidazole glycerol phosphate synthase subunit HisH n=1 Tax=Taklimakanibacter lacteus TaxID=2268456 RepID=UPI000E663D9C